MSKKTKVIATLMAMCLVISLGVIGILAVRTLNMKIGGNITFNAEGVAFTVGEGKFYEDDATTIYTGISSQTGKMQGFSMDTDTKLTDVSEAIATWTDLELGLDNRGDAILKFNVSNDMSDKKLYVVFDIAHGENTNDNMVITTQLLQEIPAGDDKDIEIKFDILDMELNAGLEGFEISVTFADVFEIASGTVSNHTTPALTNVEYTVTDATSKTVSAAMLDSDISGNVVIPDTVYLNDEPYTVTSIPEDAFSCCDNITSVYIPGTIETIPSGAFYCCEYLTTVSLGEGIKYIDDGAFAECYRIAGEFVVPDSVISIGYTAFELVGSHATRTTLKLGENLQTIEQYAFETSHFTGDLVIPSKVTTIGNNAFASMKITGLYISKSVVSIGENAFIDNPSLNTITVESGNVKYHSAGNCLIETAAGKLIQGCKNSVIPNDGTVKIIGSFAVAYTQVKSLVLPKSVTSIEDNAFVENKFESILVENGNTKYHSAGNCLIETATGKLIQGCKNSVIPNDGTVKIIGEFAFYRFNITRIVIPASVTTIEEAAIHDVQSLVELVVESTTPPEFVNKYDDDWIMFSINCTIRVPAGSVNAYKSAAVWSRHANRIVAI